MRVLIAHNAYQHRGGEDSVVAAELALLRSRGHEVRLYERHNDELSGLSSGSAAAQALWSRRTTGDLGQLLQGWRPDVLHVHNTFPLISPALYWAAHGAAVPVVQTLHNFRLQCPQAMFLRQGQVCEDCLGTLPWRAVTRSCYRGSPAQSAVLASMLVTHRALGTWRHKVTRYIALNEFCRAKFIQGGLPAERIRVKPNFVDFPAPEPAGARSSFLFVGRLAAEKGVSVLAQAARQLPGVQVRVAGEGPEGALLQGLPGVECLGRLDVTQVREAMTAARALVLPSVWYENFPMTLVESMACGLPVIASRIGALADLIEDGKTGLLFAPGDAADLAAKLAWADAHPAEMAEMGRQARRVYEARYTADRNYELLMDIYADAMTARQREGE